MSAFAERVIAQQCRAKNVAGISHFDEKTLSQAVRSLFAAGEQGIWLDPSDFSTLFQDAAGTTPVTAVGQPVGLALDKRFGLALGAELVTNGDFASDTVWTKGSAWTISNGRANRTATTSGSIISQPVTVAAGASYKVEFDYYNVTSTAFGSALRGGTTVAGPVMRATNGSGRYSCVLRAATGNVTIDITASDPNTSGSFDNFTIRELPGNHANQPILAARPTLQQDSNGLYYLSFDGTDDSLTTAAIGPFNFLHDNTGSTVHIGYSVSGTAIYHPLVATSNLAASATIGFTVSQDDRSTGFFNNLICNGSGALFVNQQITTGVSTARSVVTVRNAPASHIVRRNAVQIVSASTETGTASTANSTYALRIGMAPTDIYPLNGRIYQIIIRGAASNAGQIAAGEAWCNSKTRAY